MCSITSAGALLHSRWQASSRHLLTTLHHFWDGNHDSIRFQHPRMVSYIHQTFFMSLHLSACLCVSLSLCSNIMLECSCGLSTCPVLAANQATTQRLETLPLLLGGSGVRSALMTVGHNERDNSVYERQVMQHHLEQQIIQPGYALVMITMYRNLMCILISISKFLVLHER